VDVNGDLIALVGKDMTEGLRGNLLNTIEGTFARATGRPVLKDINSREVAEAVDVSTPQYPCYYYSYYMRYGPKVCYLVASGTQYLLSFLGS
jgi:hypothetical protein